MNNQFCLKWNNHSKAFGQSIRISQTKESFCDATLVCQGKYFPVHRFILSTCSNYFEDIFEKVKFPHLCVICQDVEPNELELLLNYMYQGEVNVEKEKLPTLIKAAEALKIRGLAVADDDIPSHNKSGKKRNRHVDVDQMDHESKRSDRRRQIQDSNHHSTADKGKFTSKEVSNTTVDLEKTKQAGSEIKEEMQVNIKKEIDDDSYCVEETFPGSFIHRLPTSTSSPNSSSEKERNREETEFLDYEDYSCISDPEIFSNANDTAFQHSSLDNFIRSNSNENLTCNLQPNISSSKIYADNGRCAESYGSELTANQISDAIDYPKKSNFQKELKCPNCEYRSSYSSTLKRHIMFRHTGECPFQCPVCFKKFKVKRHLQDHSRVHTGEKPFKCPKCCIKFSMKSSLNRHMAKQHSYAT